MKLIGAAYLVFLGVGAFFRRSEKLHVPARFNTTQIAAAFRQDILTNLLNPKVALFFLAFLPQFIDPTSTTKVPAFLTLGVNFVATGTIWCLSTTVAAVLNRAVGSLFIFLGVRLAISK